MKKYNKIAFIALIIIIILSIFLVYKVIAKNNESEDIKSKTMSEIEFVESKIEDLFNRLNNINFQNYKIYSSQIKSDSQSSESQSSGGGQSQSGSGQGQSSGGSQNGSGGGSNSSGQGTGSSENKEENKQYNLEQQGILTRDTEIDWDGIKNSVENLNAYLPTVTLDLYQTTTNQQDIIDFNNEYDNLIKIIKDEKKEEALSQLAVLYDYLPKFAENCTDKQSEIIALKTKNNIFKAYSMLEQEDWEEISKNTNYAIQEFTKLVTNIEEQNDTNQYNVNKIYVMLNELQNAVTIRDKEVFLIKYENILEELDNI